MLVIPVDFQSAELKTIISTSPSSIFTKEDVLALFDKYINPPQPEIEISFEAESYLKLLGSVKSTLDKFEFESAKFLDKQIDEAARRHIHGKGEPKLSEPPTSNTEVFPTTKLLYADDVIGKLNRFMKQVRTKDQLQAVIDDLRENSFLINDDFIPRKIAAEIVLNAYEAYPKGKIYDTSVKLGKITEKDDEYNLATVVTYKVEDYQAKLVAAITKRLTGEDVLM